MGFMKLTVAATLMTVFGGATMAADSDALVKYRKANMSAIGAHLGSVVAVLKGEAPYPDQLVVHARALADTATLTEAAFKEKAMGMEVKSTAKEDIWADWDKFSGGLSLLRERSAVLAAAADSGDMGAVGAALGDLGKTCKGCHDNFRTK